MTEPDFLYLLGLFALFVVMVVVWIVLLVRQQSSLAARIRHLTVERDHLMLQLQASRADGEALRDALNAPRPKPHVAQVQSPHSDRRDAYRRLVKALHPDQGGDKDLFNDLQILKGVGDG